MAQELDIMERRASGSRSQAGHKLLSAPVAPVTAVDLKRLRLDLPASFRVFGLILRRAIEPRARRGFSKAYVIALEQGKREITPEIAAAFWRIAAAHDEVDPTTATARTVSVWAMHDIGGALIAGKAVKCFRPGCPVRFIKTSPAQKYHSPHCRVQHHKASHGQQTPPAP